ncbi:hypothetical protein MTR67_021641 [Solanum verrucosum]|uniref:Uncharacterized protein n=1 Tax=Solanum verrucosum TaxID=315347 RepID=A0AAF0QXA4_SOLVR|nr:hypothetical protein MTR67_021641 [Solanum verrucosum]
MLVSNPQRPPLSAQSLQLLDIQSITRLLPSFPSISTAFILSKHCKTPIIPIFSTTTKTNPVLQKILRYRSITL